MKICKIANAPATAKNVNEREEQVTRFENVNQTAVLVHDYGKLSCKYRHQRVGECCPTQVLASYLRVPPKTGELPLGTVDYKLSWTYENLGRTFELRRT